MLSPIPEYNIDCCKELKILRKQFNALLMNAGNRNMNVSKLKRNLQKRNNIKEDVQKIVNMGYSPKIAKEILKVLRITNINRNVNTIRKYFTTKGTLRKEYKLINLK